MSDNILVVVQENDSMDDGLGTAEQEAELDNTRKELEDEMMETQDLLRSLQAQQDDQMKDLGELRRLMSAELKDLKEDNWKYETYAELERVKQLFSSGQSLHALCSSPSLDRSDSQISQTDTDSPARLTKMSSKEVTDPLLEELDAEMLNISAQLKAAQADRVEMEAKKKALQKDIESFTHQVIMENAAMAASSEHAALRLT
mmetsp:Transcript_26213/g.43861  ORF Transcript_26213/g.43861 Transcript_26213/m.43861 type:complete len:202 (-) Transcript_26213:215-820(-)|eukprot:CAMPEP_0198209498 /NCGR_PEP_ID=MMETSP1445-20131203/16445_1 /TAXON_ID=36898 /ORGANISM="Pyramimonas sp., Strain CCMP2087" /LENGTH=201 /DNA_ID=CAMNT_0043883293 /DNA_START=323 /DNA_END=928 /DNA_ORIENTATION=+